MYHLYKSHFDGFGIMSCGTKFLLPSIWYKASFYIITQWEHHSSVQTWRRQCFVASGPEWLSKLTGSWILFSIRNYSVVAALNLKVVVAAITFHIRFSSIKESFKMFLVFPHVLLVFILFYLIQICMFVTLYSYKFAYCKGFTSTVFLSKKKNHCVTSSRTFWSR